MLIKALLFLLPLIQIQLVSREVEGMSNPPKIIYSKKIWDKAPHSAFTDLIHFEGKWYCVFREAEHHAGGKEGVIRLIESNDGENWESTALFSEQGVDLRDPKLSITPENQLMLLLGGSEYSNSGNYIERQPRVAFSPDGTQWSSLTKILEAHEWLWRVTWYQGKAYGVSYRTSPLGDESEDRIASLFVSDDGINYQKIRQLDVPGDPTEATIQFMDSGEMVVLIRRSGYPGGHAWIGVSQAPYIDWTWKDAGLHLGGPNFVILPDRSMWGSGRVFDKDAAGKVTEKTALVKMDLDGAERVLDLPSGGEDTSYPGMIYHEGSLWVSYYSSHENEKTAIHLVKIR